MAKYPRSSKPMPKYVSDEELAASAKVTWDSLKPKAYPSIMSDQRKAELQSYDLLGAIERTCDRLSTRRRPAGRFYKREVDLALMDELDSIIREILAGSQVYIHCYEGDPEIDKKPFMYRPRDAEE
jgi:hypothetical protein